MVLTRPPDLLSTNDTGQSSRWAFGPATPPAVQSAREAARRTQCISNIKQIGIALHNYHDTQQALPPSACFWPRDRIFGGLGILVRLLPYLDQQALYDNFDFVNVPASYPWMGTKVPTYVCPSDPGAFRSVSSVPGLPDAFPSSYAFNRGEWFVWDPVTGTYGSGVFNPNVGYGMSAITDGTSHTFAVSEVKARLRGRAGQGTPSNLNAPRPATEADIQALTNGPAAFHVHWSTATIDETGFTTALVPNSGSLDFISDRENQPTMPMGMVTVTPTYAAIAARSHHVGLVHSLFLDGAVRSISENIDPEIWRALGSRAGNERIGEFKNVSLIYYAGRKQAPLPQESPWSDQNLPSAGWPG